MKKQFWLITVAAAIILLSGCSLRPSADENATDSSNRNIQPVKNALTSQAIVFGLSAKPYEYSLKEIKVKKGDKVKMILTVSQGMHDLVLDEFNAKTKRLTAGQSEAMEFTADKSGTFEYYCSVMDHRQRGMVGKLIVEE